MQPALTPWHPSKATSILLGVMAVWPALYMVLFLSFVGTMFFSVMGPSHSPSRQLPYLFAVIFPLHLLTIFLMFAMTAIFVVHALRNELFDANTRLLWAMMLIIGNIISCPIYWWLYVRPGAQAPEVVLLPVADRLERSDGPERKVDS